MKIGPRSCCGLRCWCLQCFRSLRLQLPESRLLRLIWVRCHRHSKPQASPSAHLPHITSCLHKPPYERAPQRAPSQHKQHAPTHPTARAPPRCLPAAHPSAHSCAPHSPAPRQQQPSAHRPTSHRTSTPSHSPHCARARPHQHLATRSATTRCSRRRTHGRASRRPRV